jgi:hypothetical protein
MTMLSHRAVDYSIKAYEFGDPEFGRLARNSEHEWHKVQCLIGGRGRILMAAGTPIDSDSLIARSTLRIYGALRVTYAAATEIAHNSMLIAECGLPITCREIGLMGRFVNGLVRLYTVALFKMEIRHAKTILRRIKADNGSTWRSVSLTEGFLIRLARRPEMSLPSPRVSVKSPIRLTRLPKHLHRVSMAEIASTFSATARLRWNPVCRSQLAGITERIEPWRTRLG